jgi:hypothetical protein
MNAIKRLDREQIALAALDLAWLGLWGAWIPHVTASLTQNVFYLAEWSTFLIDVRTGGLRLAPDALRLSAALAGCALMAGLERVGPPWLRWTARVGLGAPILVVLLPPYPDVFQAWFSPAYGIRFGTASVIGAGIIASARVGRLSTQARGWLVIGLGLAGIGAALAGMIALCPPFQVHYATPLWPGWGSDLFMGGLLAAGISLIGQPKQQNGPET